MSYYLIEHEIKQGDIFIPWEYDSSIDNIIKGEGTRLEKIYFEGKNESDFLSKNVISVKTKKFLLRLNLDYISFLPYTFYDLCGAEILGKEKTIDAHIMNVNNEVDCINYDKSDLFILGDGKIRGIDKLVLNDNYPKSKPEIFKIKGFLDFLCVNEHMKNEIEKSGLKGVRFLPAESYSF